MWKRLILLGVILILGLSIVGAQDSGPFCGSLSAANCTLLTKSSSVMDSLQTVAFDFDGTFEVSDLGFLDVGIDSLVIRMRGDGALNLAATGLDDFQAQMNAEIILPPILMDDSIPELVFDLIVVDGILYLDAGPLMGFQSAMWVGIDLDNYFEQNIGMTVEEFLDASAAGTGLYGGEGFYNPDAFSTIMRLADEQVMGQSVAVFETVIEYGRIFSDESFQEAYADMMALQNMDPDMLSMDLDSLLNLMAVMFKDVDFNTHQWIGLDDYYLHSGSLYFDMNLDIYAMMLALGEWPDPSIPQSITLTLRGELNLHDFNEPLDIVAPEDAQMIDPMTLLGGDF